ncbi:hypothetical protein [Modestobacter marinus]|uniref:hypothetical protein n=1 Tax=Modestobacter marinus TaxID=477641 RepID=UPI001C96D2E0|nr:hypothetical protein [Modestobacter marinus]
MAPPLRWARRFTPLGIGRRGVRLEMSGGMLSIVRVGPLGGERLVVSAPVAQFHSPAPSRNGRGLHLWHGTRVFRFVGHADSDDSGTTDISGSSAGDDPVSAVLAVLAFPLHLFAALAAHREKVAEERRHVAVTLRWLEPVVGPPWPGVAVRPPLPGGWLTAGRWTVRLTVLSALGVGIALL